MGLAIIQVGTPPGLRSSGEIDFRIQQGDDWVQTFQAFSDQPLTPFVLTGYSAAWSVRRNYGDALALYAMTTSTPSPNGSSLSISSSTITMTSVHGDTSAIAVSTGQRMTKAYYNLFVTSPGGIVTTIAAGSLYLWSRV